MLTTKLMAASIAVTGVLALAAFRKASEPVTFKEISVQRINIVEPDGKLRLTISDAALSPGWVFHGKPYPGRPKSAGMIFFNDEGEEDGGLIFAGQKVNGKVSAYGSLSFDQYDQDEAVTMRYNDNDGRRRKGLTVTDRADIPITDVVARRDAIRAMPAGAGRDSAMKAFFDNNGHPLAASRLFAGRDFDGSAVVNLSDPQGRPRLRLVVDSTGNASVQFLDPEGHVTKSVTP
jgi:hypothetical protein